MRWIPVVLFVLLAAPAEGATVRTTVQGLDSSRHGPEQELVTWQIVDRHGVADRLVVHPHEDGIEVLASRALTAGDGCRRHRPRVVRCVTPRRPGADTTVAFSADLGGGNDRLKVIDGLGAVTVSGGDGRDVLDARESSGWVSFNGGAGADRLFGSQFDDELTGGGGADVLHGGRGSDRAFWHGRRPVRADLVAGRARSAGVTDRLSSIENMSGGSGPDDLRGDARRNEIDGGAGADRIQGRAGDDRVDGEGLGGEDLAVDVVDGGSGDDWVSGLGGGDVLIGGRGDDLLRNYAQAASRRPSRARCGAGQDVVSYSRPEDLVEPSCERIENRATFGGPLVEVPPEVVADGWRVRVTYQCNAEPQTACRAAIALTEPGTSRMLGSTEVELADGAEQTIDLHLTPEGFDEVRRRGSLLGRLYISMKDGNWAASPFGATLRLRAPG